MNSVQISETVDSWIDEDEYPVRAGLKVERTSARYFNPCEGMNDEEAEAYWAFIYQHINRKNQVVMEVPQSAEFEFWPPIETDESLSFAFSSMDFQGNNMFNKYHYKLRKIYERVKDLAITYSCISDKDGKKNTYIKYTYLVENEFRDRAVMLRDTYKKYPAWVDKPKLIEEIKMLNSRIKKCKKIWQEYANWK
jgi:hypothetical protein